MPTIIEDKIEEKGLKKKWIAEQIDISTRSLSDWIRYEKIDQVIKFGKMLKLLDIPLIDIAEEIEEREKNKKQGD